MKTKNIVQLGASILICELAGIIGSIFTASSIPTWYAGLQRSALNPPSWVFGPVWTILFALMGIAAFFVFQKGIRHKPVKVALGIFAAQLILNTFWSILFFGFRSPGAALVEIIFLWMAIVATIIAFYKISKFAAYLLVPYIFWVSFAIYLNYTVWILN